MPSTTQALIVFILGFLPGALLVWSFERQVDRWVIGLTERVFRLIAVSALPQVAAAPATYAVWHEFFRSGARAPDAPLPFWLWLVALAYVGVPIAAGTILGRAHKGKKDWAKRFVASHPAPTAWDAIFSEDPAGYVLIRLKSGRWI